MTQTTTGAESDSLGNQPEWLVRYVDTYNILDASHLNLLGDIYHPQTVFVDPVHKIEGLDKLTEYFAGLYQNMNHCQFDITNVVCEGNQAAIYWEMKFSHKKIKAGETLEVIGHSLLKESSGKVIYQRDYFDVGSMVYEHVPILGSVIRLIKQKISG